LVSSNSSFQVSKKLLDYSLTLQMRVFQSSLLMG
jgi:hypothetical protein